MVFYIGKHPLKAAPRRSGVESESQDWATRMAALARQARHPALQAFYQAGAVPSDTAIDQVPLLAMDFETTGIDARRNDIVSIGLVPMTLQRIRLLHSQHWLLKPRTALRDESVVIHGITHSEVAKAPDLNALFITLLERMAGHVLVVHHRGIERQFLDAALKRRIGEGIVFPCIDTLALEARLHRHSSVSLAARLLMGRKRVSLRLPESRARYNLPHYPAHNALTDALACAELLQAQIAWHYDAKTPVEALWC
ncbi:3'-5' exonuclease [Jejubacter calystegiae]|uniref:3'-5' exonuclease n=1 Tax=Jejubacter calystegiae TaxID=2579935 RepID=A0A4P8YD24_9ENTR|nr:3'-5' exonuclease [Jejubacter calystegiae]QCT18379.1 3'-5' exonuclease [Jejubacter calystegiae]